MNTIRAIKVCLVLLLMAGIFVGSAGASYNIYKLESNAVNFAMDLSGSDLQSAKSSVGAMSYSTRSADWVVNTYFGPLNTAVQIESLAKQMGIPIPPVGELTQAGIKAGLTAKFFSLIYSNASKCKKQLTIWTVSPPFPVTWKVGIQS